VELAEVRQPTGCFHPLVSREAGAVNDELLKSSLLIARIARSWSMSNEEALRNIQARAGIREVLLQCAQVRGAEFLSPYWTSRANSYFWERMEAGQADYEGMVEGFRRLLHQGQGG
jgi:hypothetical protein